MKAAIVEKYGPPNVVSVKQVATPQIKSDEVRVKIVATTVSAADSRIRGSRFPQGFRLLSRLIFGLTKPRIRILGGSYSGVVDAVGDAVNDVAIGDAVCGTAGLKLGAHAEYIVRKAKNIVQKPNGVSHEDAAGVLFGGTTALYFLRDRAHIQPGETVCVNGASGAVGTNALQLACYFGGQVTAVTSAPNSDSMRKLGASDVIDYRKNSVRKSDVKYDVVLDTVGNIPPEAATELLDEEGRLILVNANLWERLRGGRRIITGVAPEKKADIELLLDLVLQGKLKVVIDSTYPLDAIADAHARVDSGHKVGNVLVRVSELDA